MTTNKNTQGRRKRPAPAGGSPVRPPGNVPHVPERKWKTLLAQDFEFGPWTAEPDGWLFRTRYTDMPACIVRGCMGNWIGYVGMAATHPAAGVALAKLDPACFAKVHGGVAQVQARLDDHVEIAQPPDVVWWLSFHCLQDTDVAPFEVTPYGIYRDAAFARRHCDLLGLALLRLQRTMR